MWHYHRLGWARRFYKHWYFWATHSRLASVIDVARMTNRHLTGVLNYFATAPITNATAEGLNSKIQTIKKMAYGYRNREHFKTAIFSHCGGGLRPATLPRPPPHPRKSRMTLKWWRAATDRRQGCRCAARCARALSGHSLTARGRARLCSEEELGG